MNCRGIAILVTLTALCSGCASLRIDVGVLDPEVVRAMAEEGKLTRLMPEITAEHETSLAGRFNAVRNAHAQAYMKVARAYSDEAAKLPEGSEDKRALVAAAGGYKVPQSIRNVYSQAEKDIKLNTTVLRDLWSRYKTAANEPRAELRKQLLWALDERDHTFDAFRAAIDADFREVERTVADAESLGVAERLSLLDTIRSETEPATAKEMTQLVDTNGLEHSPYAFYVANADDEQWASTFNTTVARGVFGNSDIAIKALGPTNFTIKGLSFNPADVAASASKVLTQSVLLASQIAGVPVQTAPGSTAPPLAASSNRISAAMVTNEQTMQQLLAHREALLRIATAILQEKAALADDARRPQALEAIRAVYESQATRIPMTAPSGG